MTDYERTIAFLESLTVGYRVKAVKTGHAYVLLEENAHKNVSGYPGFYTVFYFGPEGEFIEVGSYE